MGYIHYYFEQVEKDGPIKTQVWTNSSKLLNHASERRSYGLRTAYSLNKMPGEEVNIDSLYWIVANWKREELEAAASQELSMKDPNPTQIAQEQRKELDEGFAKLKEEFNALPKLDRDTVRAIKLLPLFIAVCENDLGEEEHTGLREMTYQESELVEKLIVKLNNLDQHVDQNIFN